MRRSRNNRNRDEADPGGASDRPAFLRPGGREIEPWNTFRLGKSGFYSRLDTRLEAELGLTDRLQTSLYLNIKAATADTPQGRSSSTELEGVSSEWKLKLIRPGRRSPSASPSTASSAPGAAPRPSSRAS